MQISTNERISNIVAGSYLGIAIVNSFKHYAFGRNENSEVSDATDIMIPTPEDISFDFPCLEMSAGDSHVICKSSTNTLITFGNSRHGQTGALTQFCL